MPIFLDENKIGAEGCLHLSKAHWPNLTSINLGKYDIEYLGPNGIGQAGFIYFCKQQWPKLKKISLGHNLL